jgi:hypothetical protein
MKPGNPMSFWISGSKREDFHFNAGSKLFSVVQRRRSFIPFSLVLMADSVIHVQELIIKADAQREACAVKYAQELASNNHGHAAYYLNRADTNRDRWANLIGAMRSGLDAEGYGVEISEITQGQFFKVSWSDNDTV